ncbi:hypothetical protein [Alteribacter aurantiacus]|uniref:hypothetical protein n=1 Tax=Alteribacter aurantiacus TaxID=254410 RepID=UPI000421CF8B|nr:hypothetical protein [Alteribacter aurantiacus]
MKAWVHEVFESTRRYNMLDFSFLKVCLFAMGVLFGVYFSSFFLSYLPVVWIVAILSFLYLIVRTFKRGESNVAREE